MMNQGRSSFGFATSAAMAALAVAAPFAPVRVMVSSGCSNKVKQKAEALCMCDFAGGRCTMGGEETATHFIVECEHDADGRLVAKQRTMKYLKCILRGGWILSKDWLDGPYAATGCCCIRALVILTCHAFACACAVTY